MKVEPVKQKTVVGQVMDQIKNLIATGQFKPRDRIPTETELAQMFQVGRSSVREAVKIFQYLGILETSTRKGTFVCDYTNISTEALTWSILLRKSEIFELIELRELIEERAVARLAEKTAAHAEQTAAVLQQLAEQVALMQTALSQASFDRLVEPDYEFHRLIVNSGGNSLFGSIYETLRAFIQEEIRETNLVEEDRAAAVEEHQALLAAIRSGDVGKALAAYRLHIQSIRSQLRQTLALG